MNIEIDETFYVREAIYYMRYGELRKIVNFIENIPRDEIPDDIKELKVNWERFLIDNL